MTKTIKQFCAIKYDGKGGNMVLYSNVIKFFQFSHET